MDDEVDVEVGKRVGDHVDNAGANFSVLVALPASAYAYASWCVHAEISLLRTLDLAWS